VVTVDAGPGSRIARKLREAIHRVMVVEDGGLRGVISTFDLLALLEKGVAWRSARGASDQPAAVSTARRSRRGSGEPQHALGRHVLLHLVGAAGVWAAGAPRNWFCQAPGGPAPRDRSGADRAPGPGQDAGQGGFMTELSTAANFLRAA
jgi:hypothetical protein